MRWPSRRISPRVAGSTPVTRLKVVDLPAPFGPIRPRISPARTWKLTSLTATRPPNSLRTACTSSTTSPCGGRARARQRRRIGPVDAARAGAAGGASTNGPDAVARVLQHQHEQDAEDDDLVVAARAHQARQPDLQLVLQDLHDAGADERAPDVADAAEHRHEQVLDAACSGRTATGSRCAGSARTASPRRWPAAPRGRRPSP